MPPLNSSAVNINTNQQKPINGLAAWYLVKSAIHKQPKFWSDIKPVFNVSYFIGLIAPYVIEDSFVIILTYLSAWLCLVLL